MADWIFIHLPIELLDIIWSHVPSSAKFVCNRGLYAEHHKGFIASLHTSRYHSYVRDMVRNDYAFVVKQLLIDERRRWDSIRLYNFGGFVYDTYDTFLRSLCHVYMSGRTLALLDAPVALDTSKGRQTKAYKKRRSLKVKREWTN